MNDEPTPLRLTAVHEAAHAVIGRVLGYDIATITIDEDGRGGVQTRGVAARGWDREPEHAIYCLAGIVAEERAGGDYVSDTIFAAIFKDDGTVFEHGFAAKPLHYSHDLVGAWDAVGCDYNRLEEALERTYRRRPLRMASDRCRRAAPRTRSFRHRWR